MSLHDPYPGTPDELGHAGAVVDKAIDYMLGEKIGALAIASALLGGAMEILVQDLDESSIVRVLESAIASVRSGDLRSSSPRAPQPPARQ